jgi:carbonic anhydrase
VFEIIYRFDPAAHTGRQPPAHAAEAWRRLEEGNDSFASLLTDAHHAARIVYCNPEDVGVTKTGVAPQQRPFAVVLGCSDARVPTEMILGRASNELFVVRMAGNLLGSEQLGSIDYAVENLSSDLKLLVVLGHRHCGAVTAAVDAFLRPADYLGLLSSHHLRTIVNGLFPAVRGAAVSLAAVWGEDVSRRPNYREALIDTSIILNAALTASILREEFGDPAVDRRILFGVYDLGCRRVQVHLPDAKGEAGATRLLEAPTSRDDFRRFAGEVVGGSLVRKLLES